jgi:hypothetical protein
MTNIWDRVAKTGEEATLDISEGYLTRLIESANGTHNARQENIRLAERFNMDEKSKKELIKELKSYRTFLGDKTYNKPFTRQCF